MLATTKTGFEAEVSEEALDNMELIDALAEMEDGSIRALRRALHILVGEDSTRRLYDHLRTPDGRVPVSELCDALKELIDSVQSGKNSGASRS